MGGFVKPSVRGAVSPLALHMDAALILQNKGGGHGEIGYHLAKQVLVCIENSFSDRVCLDGPQRRPLSVRLWRALAYITSRWSDCVTCLCYGADGRQLRDKGLDVRILQAADAKMNKPPFRVSCRHRHRHRHRHIPS